MAISPSLLDELNRMVRQAILPQRFPVRRDIELAAGAKDADGLMSFFDNFWIDQQVLAAMAVRIPGDGLECAVSATGMRQLLRAIATRIADAEDALATFAELSRLDDFDAALVRLDTVSGHVSSAVAGQSEVAIVNGTGLRETRTLRPGDTIWIAAGDIAIPDSGSIPLEGLQALVDPVLGRSHQGGAACAVAVKSQARIRNAATFIVPNEQHEIPAFIDMAGRFFSSQALGEDDTAGIDIALDEILTNSMNYGFRDGNRHEILVSMTAEPQRLLIEISDDGTPFDPLGVPEPDLSATMDEREIGGLGMHFVRTLLDSVSYRRSNGRNVLTLEKQLKHRGDQGTRP